MAKSKTTNAEKVTPLMKQYASVKSRYPDTVLFFRMGDFFETFGEDAVITSKITGITLTKRNNGGASETELAGFPHHQLDNYLPKMIRAGYRVAVCEQLEDPKLAKGIVKRDVVEVVTPGVQLSDKTLDASQNTFVGAVVPAGQVVGFAYADISTGEFSAGEIPHATIGDVLSSLNVKELLVARKDVQQIQLEPYFIALDKKPVLTKREDWIFHPDAARNLLLEQFKTSSLKGFGIDGLSSGVIAAGVVLDYLRETRTATTLDHLTRVSLHDTNEYLTLDQSTRRNLEIFSPIQDSGKGISLLTVLDETQTPMGARLLQHWLAGPLRSLTGITKRLDAVTVLVEARELREKLRLALRELGDIERLCGRFASARIVSPRDFLTLKFTLWRMPDIQVILRELASFAPDTAEGLPVSELISLAANELDPLQQLAEDIDRMIHPDAPTNPAHPGIIRDGANTELDELRSLTSSSKQKLLDIQERERARTGISSLKVNFNGVFGYYIEVSKANRANVPADYERRQTLTNAERYITSELKEYEEKILGAEERMTQIESEMFTSLRVRVVRDIEPLQRNARRIALVDVLLSLALCASRNKWVSPTFTTVEKNFVIENGRHPVVERSLPFGERFTPNNVSFIANEAEFFIITGPNMSGKSVFLRQAGIIALLAHIGSFVPASKCTLPLLDRIFTRVGAGDNLAGGESTFLVEMNEAANILNNATADSLLLFDELGRGTSTFDGLSIAWAISEHIHDSLKGAKTLFATHYHELNALADRYERIKNLKVVVRESEGKVHFLHKITAGYADHSYGIEVAAMAGIPSEVTDRAREILHELEETELKIVDADIQRSIPFPKPQERNSRQDDSQDTRIAVEISDELRSLNVNALTPLEALTKLSEWKKKTE